MNRFTFLLPFLLIVACSNQQPVEFEHRGEAQGSTYQIKYVHEKNLDLQNTIDELFKEIDLSMNAWLDESLITKVNAVDAGWVEVDDHFMNVLERSIEITEETNGDFDPTVGPLVRLWGFGFDEIRGDITEENIAEVQSKTGIENIEIDNQKIRLSEGSSLDFNAIAQGYTVDVIAEMLEEKGISRYMVEVGGEVRTRGLNSANKVWTIGVDKPQDQIDVQDRFQFILKLENASLATSGNYRKFWVDDETGLRYSHTIDPHTGRPAMNQLLSASIIATTAMDADAYATVCMVKGLEACKEFLSSKTELEGYLVYAQEDGNWGEYITEGFQEYILK